MEIYWSLANAQLGVSVGERIPALFTTSVHVYMVPSWVYNVSVYEHIASLFPS